MVVYHITIYQSPPVIVLTTLLHDNLIFILQLIQTIMKTGTCVKRVHYYFPKFVKCSHEDYHLWWQQQKIMVFYINLFMKFKVQARENQSWITNYTWRQLCLMIFIFLHFFILFYFSTFKQPFSILKSLFWGKQKGVEATESGNNSITEENTEENEETEDSTGADDEKMVRDNFSKDKTFWNIGIFVHPKTMLIYILYFSPNARWPIPGRALI